jgi:SAM-dependent methyltransferase
MSARVNGHREHRVGLDVEANRAYHQPEFLDPVSSLGPCFGEERLHAAIEKDIIHAARKLPDLGRAVAVDCLTGNGVHIRKMLNAGFGEIIGVDLSPTELAKANASLAAESKVELVEQEILKFFNERPGPYGFIYVNSLHHIQDYLALVRRATECLEPGGMIYVTEASRQRWLARTVGKLDGHLFTLLSSPPLWIGRIMARIGLVWGRYARAWQMARLAETHAARGIDEDAILGLAKEMNLDIVVRARSHFPATRLGWAVARLLGLRSMFRLLLQKRLG